MPANVVAAPENIANSGSSSPILSINVGSSYVSFLFVQADGTFKTFLYPYVYSHAAFSSFTTEPKFYSEVIKMVCKEINANLKDCIILATGFPEVPDLGISTKVSVSLDRIFPLLSEYTAFYVGYFKLFIEKEFVEACPMIERLKPSDTNLVEDINNEANTCIFPQIVQPNSFKKFDVTGISNFYRNMLKVKIDPKKPVAFTGYLFGDTVHDVYINYLLAIDLIKEHGTFDIRIDELNILSNLALISMHDPKLMSKLGEHKLVSLGTLLNSPGRTECLFETDNGTSQFLEIEKEKMFFVPLEEGSTARIVVKSQTAGNFEKSITGGKLGFIIDTRDKKVSEVPSMEYIEKKYVPWMNSIKQAAGGFNVPSNS